MSFKPQGLQAVSASICVRRPGLQQLLRSTFLVCAISAFSGLVSALPETDPEQVGMSSSRLALVTETLKHYVDAGHVPGVVAGVARHGKIVYLQSLGWQDVESQQPMQPDSIFQIRSMSKPITSLAIMQLIEQGRLGLDDPVSHYIPAFAGMRVFESGVRNARGQS